jgi:hypothetical protein
MIQVQLFDANDWNIQPKATFTLMDAPPVPERPALLCLARPAPGWGSSEQHAAAGRGDAREPQQ